MRYKDPKLMQDIVDFVNKYYEDNYRCPSSRTIAAAVGSNKFSVTNYLRELAEKGELFYDGRTVRTPKTELLDKNVEKRRTDRIHIMRHSHAGGGKHGSIHSSSLPDFRQRRSLPA